MIRVAAIAACLLLTGCASSGGYTVYEVAGGVNVTKQLPWSKGQDGGFAGPQDTVRFTVRRESGNGRSFVGYSHISHLSAGWPINDRQEDWLDVIEFGVRFDSRR